MYKLGWEFLDSNSEVPVLYTIIDITDSWVHVSWDNGAGINNGMIPVSIMNSLIKSKRYIFTKTDGSRNDRLDISPNGTIYFRKVENEILIFINETRVDIGELQNLKKYFEDSPIESTVCFIEIDYFKLSFRDINKIIKCYNHNLNEL